MMIFVCFHSILPAILTLLVLTDYARQGCKVVSILITNRQHHSRAFETAKHSKGYVCHFGVISIFITEYRSSFQSVVHLLMISLMFAWLPWK